MPNVAKELQRKADKAKKIQGKIKQLESNLERLRQDLEQLDAGLSSDRQRSRNGEGIYYDLLYIHLPLPSEKPVAKSEFVDLLSEYSTSNNFDAVLSQHLNRLKKEGLANNPERGQWRLTKSGHKVRKKGNK